MAWFAVYEISSSDLVSVGQVCADDATLAGKGYDKKELPDKPVDDEIWDKATLSFVKAPPVVKSADQTNAESLIGKSGWTSSDQESAFKLLLKKFNW